MDTIPLFLKKNSYFIFYTFAEDPTQCPPMLGKCSAAEPQPRPSLVLRVLPFLPCFFFEIEGQVGVNDV